MTNDCVISHATENDSKQTHYFDHKCEECDEITIYHWENAFERSSNWLGEDIVQVTLKALGYSVLTCVDVHGEAHSNNPILSLKNERGEELIPQDDKRRCPREYLPAALVAVLDALEKLPFTRGLDDQFCANCEDEDEDE
jgi:hypothetical protein